MKIQDSWAVALVVLTKSGNIDHRGRIFNRLKTNGKAERKSEPLLY